MKNAISLSATITIIASLLLTFAKELVEPIHQYLNNLTPNHWLSHSLIDLALFLLLSGLFLMIKFKKSYENVLFYALFLSSIAIVLFYLYLTIKS